MASGRHLQNSFLRKLHHSKDLDDVVLCLSEALDEKALKTLMGTMGLGNRFPKEYDAWEKRRIEIGKRFQKLITQRQAEIRKTLTEESGPLQSAVREAMVDDILKAFPSALPIHFLSLSVLTSSVTSISFRMLRRDRFSPGSTSGAPVNSTRDDPGARAGKLDNLTSRIILTWSIGTLDDVFSNYPQAEEPFLDAISDANFDNGIKGPDFHFRKERLLILLHLLKNYPKLTAPQTFSLRDAVLNNKDNQKALKLLRNFAKEKATWRLVFWKGKEKVLPKEEAFWRDAIDYATSLSDSRFLSYVKTFPDANFLHDAAFECEEAAYTCLRAQLDSLVSRVSQKIFSIQEAEGIKKVTWEINNEKEQELKVSRGEFVRKVEGLCRARPNS